MHENFCELKNLSYKKEMKEVDMFYIIIGLLLF